jgi:hypothetical protein
VKSQQLLTQGKIFEDDILAGPECTNNPAEEVPWPYDHAQNLTGTLPIELGAKSLILRVYDVLRNDRFWWPGYPGFEVIGVQPTTPGAELDWDTPGMQENADGSTTYLITVRNPSAAPVSLHFRGSAV